MRKVISIGAIAVGAGFLVGAIIEGFSWVGDKNSSDTDRAKIPNGITNVCTPPASESSDILAASEDACNKSHDAANATTLGWIFTAVGAAVGGTGWDVALLVTDQGAAWSSRAAQAAISPEDPTRCRRSPRRPGCLGLRVTF